MVTRFVLCVYFVSLSVPTVMSDVEKKQKVDYSLTVGLVAFVVGVILVIFAPMLITSEGNWNTVDFTGTGQIGDTIGGITAPIVGLLGALLVYLALRAQIQANIAIQQQIDLQNEKEKRKEFIRLKTLRDYYVLWTVDILKLAKDQNSNYRQYALDMASLDHLTGVNYKHVELSIEKLAAKPGYSWWYGPA